LAALPPAPRPSRALVSSGIPRPCRAAAIGRGRSGIAVASESATGAVARPPTTCRMSKAWVGEAPKHAATFSLPLAEYQAPGSEGIGAGLPIKPVHVTSQDRRLAPALSRASSCWKQRTARLFEVDRTRSVRRDGHARLQFKPPARLQAGPVFQQQDGLPPYSSAQASSSGGARWGSRFTTASMPEIGEQGFESLESGFNSALPAGGFKASGLRGCQRRHRVRCPAGPAGQAEL